MRLKKNKYQEIEIEELFLDKLSREKDIESEISVKKLEMPLERINFLTLFLLGFFVFGMFLFFTFRFQILERENYVVLAQENKFITSYIKSERGIIYDRNKEQIVFNEVSFDLWFKNSETEEGKDWQNLITEISGIINGDSGDLKKKIEGCQDGEEVLLKKDLSHQDLILIQTKLNDYPNLLIKKRLLRHYNNTESLSHILGYLGKISAKQLNDFKDYAFDDYIGREGVERSLEEVLRERKGIIQIERDAKSKEISRKIIEYPQSGDSLVLTIDLSLQNKIEEVLRKTLKEVNSEAGAAIALNPRNSEVLASVSLPSFNNNLFAEGIASEELQKLNEDERNPQLNRVVAGVYLIGSTIKPLIGSAALQEGIITKNLELYCPLELCVKNKYTGEKECFSDWEFHGLTNIKKAVAESVNPFFYMIGGGYVAPDFADSRLPKNFEGLGVERIKKYLELFGLGQKTGIDLPGETKGRVPDPAWKESYFDDPQSKKWYLGDTYNLSIGQGYILVTPIQLANAFASLINEGTLFKPQIVKEILDQDGNKKTEVQPKILRKDFISRDSLDTIKEGMRQAVSSPSGSAFLLNSLPVRVAAKTGTAQVTKKDYYNNWIAVFGPFDNPEILLVILIEDVKGTRIAAQKVAQEVLQWYFTPAPVPPLLERKDGN